MGAIVKRATAGTMESSDVYVELSPWEHGVELELDSVVYHQFGDEILRVVREVLDEFAIKNAKVKIVDRGALECVLRARVETAILRGGGAV